MQNKNQSPSTGNVVIPLPIFVGLFIVIALLIVAMLVFMFLPKQQAISPTLQPTVTAVAVVVTETSTETPGTPIPTTGAPDKTVNEFYQAIRTANLGAILDDLTTKTLSQNLQGSTKFTEKALKLKGNVRWEIVELKPMEFSFQRALVRYTSGTDTACEILEIANPETTGDHWRVDTVSDALCETGNKLPTPTATAVTFYVPTKLIPYCGPWYPNSRLEAGMGAKVSTYPGLPNNLRIKAGKEEERIGSLEVGEEVRILSGPYCVDGWIWWLVESMKNGEKGYTSEGNELDYWLDPSRPVGS